MQNKEWNEFARTHGKTVNNLLSRYRITLREILSDPRGEIALLRLTNKISDLDRKVLEQMLSFKSHAIPKESMLTVLIRRLKKILENITKDPDFNTKMVILDTLFFKLEEKPFFKGIVEFCAYKFCKTILKR